MLKKENLEDILSSINNCRNQLLSLLSKIDEEYCELSNCYQSSIINGEITEDRLFIEDCQKGRQQLVILHNNMMDIFSSLEREAIDSSNSWFEIIPTVFND